MKIKITTGFSDDEKFTIDAEEAHKAYYLFLHPEKRAVFSNGVALIGKNIQSILPDYHATMGWNSSHRLDDNDWNEIKAKGVDKKLKLALEGAKNVAYLCERNQELMARKLSDIDIKLLK